MAYPLENANHDYQQQDESHSDIDIVEPAFIKNK